MKDFLKFMLATIVGILITFVMCFFLLLIIISASSKDKPVELKPNTILHITLSEQIVERSADSPFNMFPSEVFASMKEIGLMIYSVILKKRKAITIFPGYLLNLIISPLVLVPSRKSVMLLLIFGNLENS
jgi:protease-4